MTKTSLMLVLSAVLAAPAAAVDFDASNLTGQFQAKSLLPGAPVIDEVKGAPVASDDQADEKTQDEKDAERMAALLEKISKAETVPQAEVDWAKAQIAKASSAEELKKARESVFKALKEQGLTTEEGEVILAPNAPDEEVNEVANQVMMVYKQMLTMIRAMLAQAKTA